MSNEKQTKSVVEKKATHVARPVTPPGCLDHCHEGFKVNPLTIDERIQLDRLSLKKVVSHKDHNGAPLTDFHLYLDGKKIAEVECELFGAAPVVKLEEKNEDAFSAFITKGGWSERLIRDRELKLIQSEYSKLEYLIDKISNAPFEVFQKKKFLEKYKRETKKSFVLLSKDSVRRVGFGKKLVDVMKDPGGKEIVKQAFESILKDAGRDFYLVNSNDQLVELGLAKKIGKHHSIPENELDKNF